MRIFSIFILVLISSVSTVFAALVLTDDEKSRASELFTTYRKALKLGDFEEAREAIDTLVDELPPDAAEMAVPPLEKETRTLVDAYRRKVAEALGRHSPAVRLKDPKVAEARQTLQKIRAMGNEDAMKAKLKTEGKKALETLEKILLPKPKALLAGELALQKERTALLVRIEIIEVLRDAASFLDDSTLRDGVESAFGELAGLDQIATSDDRAVLKSNAPVLSELPPREAGGIRDANRLRILLGLPALAADEKLCLASRGHSKDMVEKGFFAHDSPVPGKKTPWVRARAAGTSASAENIAAGQTTGAGANMAWFYSPGHHKNLFAGHKRIGLGNHGNTWTQMFGR